MTPQAVAIARRRNALSKRKTSGFRAPIVQVGADVCGAVPVPVQWHELAVPLCATPQSANILPHRRLLLLPWPARAETSATCL